MNDVKIEVRCDPSAEERELIFNGLVEPLRQTLTTRWSTAGLTTLRLQANHSTSKSIRYPQPEAGATMGVSKSQSTLAPPTISRWPAKC
jgi:hypothetical protein